MDLKIEGHYNNNNRDSEEEGMQGFLPPIRQSIIQMETKFNMYNPQSSTKYQNNPFKQTFQNIAKKKNTVLQHHYQ